MNPASQASQPSKAPQPDRAGQVDPSARAAVRAPVHLQPKGWGHEVWIHNDARYCGKILFVKAGKRCSLHFHRRKYETFYVQSGRVRMRLRDPDGSERVFEMKKGDCLEIPQGTAHQFTGVEDCELFEFSTQHFEDDSHRLEKGD